MRRRPIPCLGIALGAALALAPLAGHAAAAPSITLLTPSSGDLVSGVLSVRWSYSGFYRTTPVDIEVSRAGGPFRRVGRAVVDDGTPGYFGSASWSTGPDDDGADYTVRVVMPTRRAVTSAVSPVGIDNTGPTTTIRSEPPVEGTMPTAVLSVDGAAADAIAGVASVAVTFTDATGTQTVRQATCQGCGTPSATWSASSEHLPVGVYDVTAVGVDVLANVGAPTTARFVVIGVPPMPDPTPTLETVEGVVGTVTDLATDPPVDVSPEDVIGTVTGTVTGTTTVGEAVTAVTGLAGGAGAS